MEINELLSLETFPKSYEACFLENCVVKEIVFTIYISSCN